MIKQTKAAASFRSIESVGRTVKRLSLDEARQMLVEARAPEPWAKPDMCQQLAYALHLAETQVIWKTEAPSTSTRAGAWARAQAAVNELRCVLPEILEQLNQTDFIEIVPADQQEEYKEVLAEKQAETERLLSFLVDFTDAQQRVQSQGWHEHCISFWAYYWLIVGSGAPTRNGPANRFVTSALRQVGYGNTAKPPAIEDVITKWLRAGGRDQLSRMEASWSSTSAHIG